MLESFNFSSGPAMLPRSVMLQAKEQLLDFKGGMSAMEISHRHRFFLDLLEELNNNLIKLLHIPSNYKILWTTGGATAQFDLIPLNLLGGNKIVSTLLNQSVSVPTVPVVADYFCTGHWSLRASQTAAKYLNVNKVVDNKVNNYTSVEDAATWQFSEQPLYVYYTPNETISGLRFDLQLECLPYNVPLVADMTSFILSESIDVSKFGIIFASVQKNMGISGVTLIIIRDDLLQKNDNLSNIFNYEKIAENNSLVNTPPTYNLSIVNLVLQWLIDLGGVQEINKLNKAKAQKLYDFIDNSGFYCNRIAAEFRSIMNVTFDFSNKNSSINNSQLVETFIQAAEQKNLYNLAGHRTLGGFRAGIYNAMPMAGVDALIEFMSDFAVKN